MFSTAAVLFMSAVAVTADPATDQVDQQAREAVVQFLKAFKSRDLDGVMAAADAPWFHDAKKVISARDELRKEFNLLFEKKTDLSQLTFTVKQVLAYRTVRTKTSDEERKLLDEVLREDDRILVVHLENAADKKDQEKIILLARLRDGKAKVVGIKN